MTDTVVVVGPELAGVTAVAEALRGRLDGCAVVERPGPGLTPDAVVFVTSAAAPISGCDAALLAEVSARTDTVVGAVTKIDVHRTWPAVLEANRCALPDHPWVGVAADPAIGPPVIGPLVDAVRAALDDERGRRRNALRAREWALKRRIADHERDCARRAEAVRRSAVRTHLRQARIDLAGEARARSAALRADIQREAAMVSWRALDSFADRVGHRAQQVAGDFDRAVAARMAQIATAAGAAVAQPAPRPPIRAALPPPRRTVLEDRLAAVLGTGFGLGVALTAGRFLAQIAPAATPAVVALCGAAGVGLALWVVRTRRLVLARAALDRWAAEVAAGVRAGLEERLLAAESALVAGCVDVAARAAPDSGPSTGRVVDGWIGELERVRAELRGNPN